MGGGLLNLRSFRIVFLGFFTLVRSSEIRGFCKKKCFRLHEEDETVDSSLSFNIRINRIAGNTLKMIGIIIQRKI